MATRAQIMSAILSRIETMSFAVPINGCTTWQIVSNRLVLWGDCPAQPACYLVTHRETDEYRNLGVLRRRLDLRAFCYSRSDAAAGGSPGQVDLDTMMQSFEAAFCPADDPSTNTNTLGGLVYWCRIEGQVFKDPGDLDNQAMLIVPLLVEMP